MDFCTCDDVSSGLIKAAVFGFIIALMGCYHGFNSKGGAQGVGAATTNAVVSASILILAANYHPHLRVLRADGDATAHPKSNSAACKKRFGPKVVLDGIDLTIEHGRVRWSSSAARAPASR